MKSIIVGCDAAVWYNELELQTVTSLRWKHSINEILVLSLSWEFPFSFF